MTCVKTKLFKSNRSQAVRLPKDIAFRFKTPVTIIDDRQITDTLFEAVEQAMKFILSHIKVSFEFDGALQRKERFA